jgi:response regulator RpfG family c-di-GMP phosphodiesterase
LGDYADLKLPERAGHARRVARLASTVAEVANLDDGDAEVLVQAALVHDVGMVAVPVGVWRSGARAGDTESELVRCIRIGARGCSAAVAVSTEWRWWRVSITSGTTARATRSD